MPTFFEKLTGASPAVSREAQAAGNPVFSEAQTTEEEVKKIKKQAKMRSSKEMNVISSQESAKPLKVETEEVITSTGEESMEEEGELTVDIYDRGDAIVIQATVAGVKPEDLDISLTSDTVTIRGRRLPQEKVEERDYYYKELFWGAFARTVILPEEIDDTEAEATMKNGLLTVVLPKKKRGAVQKVKVKVA